MTSIALYVEGGGNSEAGKAALRQGFDELIATQKNAARARKMNWKTVFCGGRNATFDAFLNATQKKTADIVVLVVDAEEAIETTTAEGRVAHLEMRDSWTFVDIDANRVHLMTQCMEAWIIADGEKLAEFYGKDFHVNALPKRQDLDEEPKANLYVALEKATKDTKKGCYGKIKHARELLKRIRPSFVAARCTSFQHFTQWLDTTIAGA